MDLREKVYRMFILGTQGGGYKSVKGLGGIIFFSHDIQFPEQFYALVSSIKQECSPIFLSVDQEGGRVERTENIHNGKKYLSAKYACQKGSRFLKEQTENIAKELKSYGLNLNFAPCIDVNTNPQNPIIAERAFSDNPDTVIECEKIVSKTYMENGIIPCVKHYPGHGDASKDSHLTLPEIDLSLDEMNKVHIKPFRACAKRIPMVMAAHLNCKCFNKEGENLPVSLNKRAIDYLRNDLGFEGIIISDDMAMKGVADFDGALACEMGIKAGLNMFIYRNSEPETMQIIENVIEKAQKDDILRARIEESCKIISNIKLSY